MTFDDAVAAAWRATEVRARASEVPSGGWHPLGSAARAEDDRARHAARRAALASYLEAKAVVVALADELGTEEAQDQRRFFGPSGRRWCPREDGR